MKPEQQQGIVAILTANIIFGLNIPVTKLLMEFWMTPLGYTMTRMLYGTLIFWMLGLFFQKEKVVFRDLLIMAVGGLLGFLGAQFLFSQSLKYTTPVVFSLLIALTHVVVLLLSAIFLKEEVRRRKMLGILISISGAFMIILLSSVQNETGSNNGLGVLFAVLCVLSYATYLVFTKKISIKYQPITIAKWMFLFSALVALPFSLPELASQRLFSAEANWQALGLLAFALLFSTTLAFFLIPYALKRIEAGTVSVFMNLQPIIASSVAIVIGQDFFTWGKLLATILVILGVYIVTTNRKEILVHKRYS